MSVHRDVLIGLLLIVIATLVLSWSYAYPMDGPAWDKETPAIREWYKNLMQPDVPTASCCGLADAYWCDTIITRTSTFDGKVHVSCRITDDRPDAPLNGRPHIPMGTEIEIPEKKLKWDRGNPTGHAIVFLGRGGQYGQTQYVFCFVQGTGI